MTKKKTDEFEVAMDAAVENNEEMEDVADDVSDAILEELSMEEVSAPTEEAAEPAPKKKRTSKKKAEEPTVEMPEEPDVQKVEQKATPKKAKRITKDDAILTIDAGDTVHTEEDLAEIAWHEIHNAYRTRKILTGMLGGIEQLGSGNTVCVVEYKGYRIIIPIKEMTVAFPNKLSAEEYENYIVRQHKLISNMLGAEIDFVVKGIDSKTRSVVASRRDAMLKKRMTFYMETDANGSFKIFDGRIVQARVIAVAEKAIRIEVFGVDTTILARDLSWDWIGDAHDKFAVGDEILVRILSVNRENIETLSIKADVKSAMENYKRPNLGLCRIQSKYAGKVTDVHRGVVYVRLTNGINAIAHSCLDRRMPAKKDDVSFAVTNIDETKGIAIGIITRIIKQNL